MGKEAGRPFLLSRKNEKRGDTKEVRFRKREARGKEGTASAGSRHPPCMPPAEAARCSTANSGNQGKARQTCAPFGRPKAAGQSQGRRNARDIREASNGQRRWIRTSKSLSMLRLRAASRAFSRSRVCESARRRWNRRSRSTKYRTRGGSSPSFDGNTSC